MKKILALAAALAVGSLFADAAQAWPDKPTNITVTVGSSAGGPADLSVRLMAPYLQKYLGSNASIVVVNMPGAGGEIAFNDIAQAAPDGTKINVASFPNLVSRIAESKDTKYSLDSFTYLGHIISSPAAIAVPANSPYKSLNELIDFAKANPGKLTSAVGGIGNDDHLLTLRLMRDAGIEIRVIPFGDGAQARNAVLGGQVDVGTMGAIDVSNFRDQLRALAVFSAERMSFLQDVPTAKEQGLDLVAGASRGVLAPAGLPDDIRDAFSEALAKVVADPAYLADMQKASMFIDYKTAADFEAYSRNELKILQELFAANPWK